MNSKLRLPDLRSVHLAHDALSEPAALAWRFGSNLGVAKRFL